jgi:hypothetical protein
MSYEEANAALVDRVERGWATRQEIAPNLQFVAWHAESARLHVLDKKAPGLWAEVATVYTKLQAAAWGGEQPTSIEMRELAKRLRAAGF